MQQQTMRQITLACCILGVAVFLGSAAIVVLGWLGAPVASLKLAASGIMILTLVLQIAFVVSQLSRAGRVGIPIKGFGPDAWVFTLIATGVPGVLWPRLSAYAGMPASLLMPGFVTPIVTMAVFLVGREIQQRNLRNRIERSRAPVA